MKNIWLVFLMLFSFTAFASEPTGNVLKEGEIILQTIDNLTKNGYITEKNALEAKKEYVLNNPEVFERIIDTEKNSQNKIDDDISWTEHITFVNSIFFIATICALIAFHGVIIKLIKSGLFFILKVPVILYQLGFLALSLTMTFRPDLLWMEYSFYIALFGSIANILVLGWMAVIYDDLFEKLINLISLGLNKETMVNLWLCLYFGMFAIANESQTFGLFSVIFLVATTWFAIVKLSLKLGFRDKSENAVLGTVVFSNLGILAIYILSTISALSIPYINLFSVGIEYVCTLALMIALIVNSSPWSRKENNFLVYFMLMIIVSILGFCLGIFFDLTVIAAFTNTFFIVFIGLWVFDFLKETGKIIIMTVLSALLYGLGKLLSKYPELFITTLW